MRIVILVSLVFLFSCAEKKKSSGGSVNLVAIVPFALQGSVNENFTPIVAEPQPETETAVSGLMGVLKTGQIECYDTSHSPVICATEHDGQDARERRGKDRSYTDKGDGTIKDNST